MYDFGKAPSSEKKELNDIQEKLRETKNLKLDLISHFGSVQNYLDSLGKNAKMNF